MPGPYFAGSFELTGGTGRFVAASGDGTFSGLTDRPTRTIPVFEMEGTIRYDAATVSGR